MIIDDNISRKYKELTELLIENNITISTMESCTSGLIASLITDTEGASSIMKGAFVTYSNEAKIKQGVPAIIIEQYGVYSKETAAAMSEACRKAYDADIGIGITGSFGNVDPNNTDSVPGEVYYAIATRDGTESFYHSIPLQSTRLVYKLYMADIIVNLLLKRLM